MDAKEAAKLVGTTEDNILAVRDREGATFVITGSGNKFRVVGKEVTCVYGPGSEGAVAVTAAPEAPEPEPYDAADHEPLQPVEDEPKAEKPKAKGSRAKKSADA
jgi:hypothetical protein